MVQCGATKDTALSCSSNATGRPQALSSRNTLQVVAVASRPLSGMTSCLAPSPAVMSSLETIVTSSGRSSTRWIFLVLPSVTRAPSGYLVMTPSEVRASTARPRCCCDRSGIDQTKADPPEPYHLGQSGPD